MSRKFKFRVWDKDCHRFIDSSFDDHLVLNLEGKLLYTIDSGGFDYSIKDNLVIQQYTGIKDKKGKEIYEGDILKCIIYNSWFDKDTSSYNKLVEFKSSHLSGESELCGFLFIPIDREIIGNIFETPELLINEK